MPLVRTENTPFVSLRGSLGDRGNLFQHKGLDCRVAPLLPRNTGRVWDRRPRRSATLVAATKVARLAQNSFFTGSTVDLLKNPALAENGAKNGDCTKRSEERAETGLYPAFRGRSAQRQGFPTNTSKRTAQPR